MRGDAGFPVRIHFSKRGKVRFISHRDVARAFDRAFRIEALPLAFTAGFVPRPKVSFGLALSVGHESDAEYLDVQLDHAVDLDAWPVALSAALPVGIDVIGACVLAERAPALQESVTAVEYRLAVSGAAPSELGELVERGMTATSLPIARTKKGREVVEDVRPLVRTVRVVGGGNGVAAVDLEIATQPRSARPGEVIAAIGGHLTTEHALRTHQWIERGGARLSPMDADARMRVPEARAS